MKWRIWHSAESFARFIVDNSRLCEFKNDIEMLPLAESDAAKSAIFSKVPDHIKKILYLDAPDVIIELNSEPIVCIEETKEAGTGHNVFQRFARIAAAVENSVPAIYIMPEAKVISRKNSEGKTTQKWDTINPAIFRAFDDIFRIFDIPALLFYYPSYYKEFPNPDSVPSTSSKGLKFNPDLIAYPACPEIDDEMKEMFGVIDSIIDSAINNRPISLLNKNRTIDSRRKWLQKQYHTKCKDKDLKDLSPLTATVTVPTEALLDYLRTFATSDNFSELLPSREKTIIYCCDAEFRGDPYAGTLAAIDYLACRIGRTYEDRDANLVLCFGSVEYSEGKPLVVKSAEPRTQTRAEGVDSGLKCSVNDFIKAVSKCGKYNLLNAKQFCDIDPKKIGRYYMQVRYGSMYSKAKHIRVFSYFADAIIFADGALWREA